MGLDMSAIGIDITADLVIIFRQGMSKHVALDMLIDAIAAENVVSDTEAFRQAVHDRESVMSTGIGSGVAIPHVRIDAVERPTVGVGISRDGIDFNALDDEPVHIVIMFAMPAGTQKEYLKLLARVMISVKKPGFRETLLACASREEVASLLSGNAA